MGGYWSTSKHRAIAWMACVWQQMLKCLLCFLWNERGLRYILCLCWPQRTYETFIGLAYMGLVRSHKFCVLLGMGLFWSTLVETHFVSTQAWEVSVNMSWGAFCFLDGMVNTWWFWQLILSCGLRVGIGQPLLRTFVDLAGMSGVRWTHVEIDFVFSLAKRFSETHVVMHIVSSQAWGSLAIHVEMQFVFLLAWED